MQAGRVRPQTELFKEQKYQTQTENLKISNYRDLNLKSESQSKFHNLGICTVKVTLDTKQYSVRWRKKHSEHITDRFMLTRKYNSHLNTAT